MRRYLLAIMCLFGLLAPLAAASSPAQSGRRRAAPPAPPGAEAPSLSNGDIASPPAPAAAASPDTHGSTDAPTILWQTSFEAARKKARHGQMIVVDVYTDWCGWCKYMDRTVYADPSVVAFAAEHVFVKVNAEEPGEGEAFAKRAGVHGFPTTLVYGSDGRLRASYAGAFRRPAQFLAWVRSAARG